jgi:hypothetical protein
MNANQFFANSVGAPTPFNDFNQWAAGAQGPIWENHTFFDVDYEGLRNVLSTASNLTLVPSQQFQSATLNNLVGVGNGAGSVLQAAFRYLQWRARRRWRHAGR